MKKFCNLFIIYIYNIMDDLISNFSNITLDRIDDDLSNLLGDLTISKTNQLLKKIVKLEKTNNKKDAFNLDSLVKALPSLNKFTNIHMKRKALKKTLERRKRNRMYNRMVQRSSDTKISKEDLFAQLDSLKGGKRKKRKKTIKKNKKIIKKKKKIIKKKKKIIKKKKKIMKNKK